MLILRIIRRVPSSYAIGNDKLLLDCCLTVTLDLYSCIFLYQRNNCLQVENLDVTVVSSSMPDLE